MDAALSLTGPLLPRARAAASIRVVREEELTDGELIERVGEGDSDAFDELYRRYTRPVLGLALRRLGDRGRAEDALQDAFAAIWRSASSYDPARGQGGAWLYTVARNAIVDGARRRPEPPMDVPDEASGEIGPPEQAEAAWLARLGAAQAEAVLDAAQRLPPDAAMLQALRAAEAAAAWNPQDPLQLDRRRSFR